MMSNKTGAPADEEKRFWKYMAIIHVPSGMFRIG